MSEFENNVGRAYARDINALAREANDLIAQRKRLIIRMENAGWMIFQSERSEGKLAHNYAPIISSIKRVENTILEIKS